MITAFGSRNPPWCPTGPRARTVSRAGFAVVLQDCRGRFGSDGVFDPSVHEAGDGEDTVAWAVRLPWSDGRVGMWGRSYFAETLLTTPRRHRWLTRPSTWGEFPSRITVGHL
jgi:putative CocE/NonD family hydrolase